MEPAAVAERQPDTLLQFLETALREKHDPATMKELIALYRENQAHEAEKAFGVSLVACQIAMPIVREDATNTHTRSNYAKLETMQQAARPVWEKFGFALSWYESEEQPMSDMVRLIMCVRHCGGHVHSVPGNYPRDGEGAKGGSSMNRVQGTVSTKSYAQRDMTRQYFNIVVAGLDKDGNAEKEKLTQDQVGSINLMIDMLAQLSRPVDMKRFYAWLKVDSMADVCQRQYPQILEHLERKLKEAKS